MAMNKSAGDMNNNDTICLESYLSGTKYLSISGGFFLPKRDTTDMQYITAIDSWIS